MNRSTHTSSAFRRRCLIGAILVPGLLLASPAVAQVWSDGRTTPSIAELVIVDATGEPGWRFGEEDVAGDGSTFDAAEQSVDVRSVYAVTEDPGQLWWRAYVSSADEPDPSLRLYLFIDSDRDATTGGSAAATDIEPAFVTDPSNGGYEHVFGISAEPPNGAVIDVWDYRASQGDFEPNAGSAQRAQTQLGTDTDPLYLSGEVHGFVSGLVTLDDVNLGQSCDADLFVRAVSDQGNDLNVGTRIPCVPPDDDGNGLPDVVQDVTACDEDADCPARGRCISGECRYAPVCTVDDDCAANDVCSDGSCIGREGDDCDSSETCGGLVCQSESCARCGEDGVECAAGQACGADGRCVDVDVGEVRGGAFTCGIARNGSSGFLWSLIAPVALGLRRRRNA